MKGISIVVCCYNSEGRLSATMQALAKQRVSNFPWEIIVVDNASTDNTASIAESLARSLPPTVAFTLHRESRPGLSYARKAGVEIAKFDYVIFCDDDNWLQDDYLQEVFVLMEQHEDIGVLGGQGIPVPEGETPSWFRQSEKSYALGPQAGHSGPLNRGEIIYGAGMVIRKKPLEELYARGFVSFLSDRKGKDLVSGGDNELCTWFVIMGYRLYYSEKLVFRHFIPADRLTENYLLRRSAGKGKTEAILRLLDDAREQRTTRWMVSSAAWYAEIVKRMVYGFWFTLTPRPLSRSLTATMLWSSVKFRLSNRSAITVARDGIIDLAGYIRKELRNSLTTQNGR